MKTGENKFIPYTQVGISAAAIKPLHSMLPLAVPFALLIDPSNRCNFRCAFCPTGDHDLLKSLNRPGGVMEYPLFQKIIVDTAALVREAKQKIRRVHLYKDGEPLVNKHFARMARLAVENEIAESVETTTNASLLTAENVAGILDSGLHVIRISVDGVNDAMYKRVTGTFSDYEKIRRNAALLREERDKRNSVCKIHVKIVDVGLTAGEKEKFLDDFSPVADSINVDGLMGWSNTEYKDWTLGGNPSTGMEGKTALRERKVCSEPFSKLAVNFDGQVSACCVDWSYGAIVGDFNRENLKDIWHGEKLNQFRLTHLHGRRDTIKACKSCQYLLGLPEYAMLDKYADELCLKYS